MIPVFYFEVLSAPDDRHTLDLHDHKTEFCHCFTEAWKLAHQLQGDGGLSSITNKKDSLV